jgi:hypothetical protein
MPLDHPYHFGDYHIHARCRGNLNVPFSQTCLCGFHSQLSDHLTPCTVCFTLGIECCYNGQMTPAPPLFIDWPTTSLRELVDFIGPRLECESENDGVISLLVFYSLSMRKWPGACVYLQHPSGGQDIPYSMLEQKDECLSPLGKSFEQIMAGRYEKQPPREEWEAFYPAHHVSTNYYRSVAASNPKDFAVINRALDQFSVELVARRLREATRDNPSASVSSRPPRL